MVSISVAAVGAYGYLEKQSALELENGRLKEALRAQALEMDVQLSAVEHRYDRDLTEATDAIQNASEERDLAVDNARRWSSAFARVEAERAEIELVASAALERATRNRARADAALAMAEASEAYALEMDVRLSRAVRERDLYRRQGANLRALASRHLASVAPDQAQTDLDLLRKDLAAAKQTTDSTRPYRIGMACSGLRTFEATASGYEDELGRSLLTAARALRADAVCVAFDHGQVDTLAVVH